MSQAGSYLGVSQEASSLRDELEVLRDERDKYRRMIDKLFDTMVTFTYRGSFTYDEISHVTIMLPGGWSTCLDGVTRKQAEDHWRHAWGLDRI